MRTKRWLLPLCVFSWILAASGAVSATVISHTVVPGESLSVVAEKEGLLNAAGLPDWRRLCDANEAVKDPNLIFAGQELRVPGVAETVEPRAVCELPVATSAAKVSAVNLSKPGASGLLKTAPSQKPQAVSSVEAGPGSGDDFVRLRGCESNGYGDRRNSLYRGAYQFSYSTWESVGGTGDPADASPQEQDRRAAMLQARDGWDPWPTCRVILGLW